MAFFKIKATIEAFTTYIVEADSEEEAIHKYEQDDKDCCASGDLETDRYAVEEFEECTQLNPEQEAKEREYRRRRLELQTEIQMGIKQLKLESPV